jgi:hypothetical protein
MAISRLSFLPKTLPAADCQHQKYKQTVTLTNTLSISPLLMEMALLFTYDFSVE